MDCRYDLVLPFDTDDEGFVRGVEVGMLWQRLQVEPLPVHALLHASNAEMAFRMAEARQCAVRSEELGGDWLAASYE